jgi:isocitrate lyase
MGYKFQFVTLAGFHSLNHGMFELSQGYSKRGMAAYAELQQVNRPTHQNCACGLYLAISGKAMGRHRAMWI